MYYPLQILNIFQYSFNFIVFISYSDFLAIIIKSIFINVYNFKHVSLDRTSYKFSVLESISFNYAIEI